MPKTKPRVWDLLHIESRASYGDDALDVAKALLKTAKGRKLSTLVLTVSFMGEDFAGSIHWEE